MEKKSPCNSRPIIGIVIVGGQNTNVKEQVALSHLRFTFPSSQGGVGSISSAGQITGLQMSKTMINSSSSKSYLGHGYLLSQHDYNST